MQNFGKRILLTYGGGSIKKIGLYDRVKELLKGYEIVELSGIQPNPKYDPSVLDGVRLCKEHNIAVNEGLENAYVPLTEQDIKKILMESL